MFSNNLDKYEYLTGEDLGLKPSTVEQAKFEYSPLGKIFNKGLDKDDQKEGLFKRLENIKDKNEEQLQAIKDQGEKQLKELKNIDKSKTLKAIGEISKKNDEANKLLSEFRKIDETLDNAELVCTKTDGTKYDFNRFLLPLKFIEKIHNYEITLDEARNYQTELRILINKLNNGYNPWNPKKAKEKNNVLESARKFLNARKDIIGFFEKGTFPYKGNVFKTKEEESEENKLEKIKDDYKFFFKYIQNESKSIRYELFKRYFYFLAPIVLAKYLYDTKDKKENNELVNVIKSGIIDLKDEIEKMSEDEKKIEKPDKILKIVEEILEFNKQNQSWKGLKILTPNQMFSRLPISLAQLKAGNNSEKLKNEIRQILHSLYKSKKLTKQFYRSLTDII